MSNATPFFSIIVPVYNTVKELRRCTDSVLCQTCRDFELILVDDGSRDGSGELCDEIAARDDRVVCIHKENGGCSEARNTGIRAARGTYLLFVDSDDMWDDANALTEIFGILFADPEIDMVCFGVSIYSESGAFEKRRVPSAPPEPVPTKKELFRHLVRTNQFFSTSYVKVLRKEFFTSHNMFFIKGLLSEDIEWSARLMIYCRKAAVYSHAFYKRIRREDGSITSSIGRKNILDILGSIENGTTLAAENAEDTEMLDIYLEYWTYQYAMLLGLAEVTKKEPDFPEILSRLKKLKWLLKYDHVKKVKAVRCLTAFTGIRISMWILSKYYKVK